MFFIIITNVLKQSWKIFNSKFGHQWKDWKRSYQVKQILATFSYLIPLILGWKSVKDIKVSKIVKEIKFQSGEGKLESKTDFFRQSVSNYLRLILVFISISTLWEKFNFYFSLDFC